MKLELVQEEIPIGLNVEALEEWIEYRRAKGKELSDLALKKSRNFLLKHDLEHQQAIVDAAIMNDWQGLHTVEKPQKRQSRDVSFQEFLTNRDWAK